MLGRLLSMNKRFWGADLFCNLFIMQTKDGQFHNDGKRNSFLKKGLNQYLPVMSRGCVRWKMSEMSVVDAKYLRIIEVFLTIFSRFSHIF
jgi:hypothetical protein